MRRIYSVFFAAFLAFFGFVANAFAAWDLTAIEAALTAASTDIKTYFIAIITALVTLWIGRKFIKTTNKS